MCRSQEVYQKRSKILFGKSSTLEHFGEHPIRGDNALQRDDLFRIVGINLGRLFFISPSSIPVHKIMKISDPEEIKFMTLVIFLLIVGAVYLPHLKAARTVGCGWYFSDNFLKIA